MFRISTKVEVELAGANKGSDEMLIRAYCTAPWPHRARTAPALPVALWVGRRRPAAPGGVRRRPAGGRGESPAAAGTRIVCSV